MDMIYFLKTDVYNSYARETAREPLVQYVLRYEIFKRVVVSRSVLKTIFTKERATSKSGS